MQCLILVLVAAFTIKAAHCSYFDHHATPYQGPLAKPVVLKSGFLADTHEVAAAKRAHQATLEKQSHQAYHHEEGHGFSHDHDHLKYHGPTAIPHVLHDGHIADTHEVAAARAEHLAVVAKAKVHGEYRHESAHTGNHGYDHHSTPYHGPFASPVVLKSGYLADTHEVAAAKRTHQAALEKQSHLEEGQYFSHDQGHLRYHGPTAIPHVLHDGHIADTHEVAAAREEHLAAVAKAKIYGRSQHESNERAQDSVQEYEHHSAPYHGPIAKPVVLETGFLADTHEVAAAKENHLETQRSNLHGQQYNWHQ